MRKLVLVASVLLLGAALAQADVNLFYDGGEVTQSTLPQGGTSWTESVMTGAGVSPYAFWVSTANAGITLQSGAIRFANTSNNNIGALIAENLSLSAGRTITLSFDLVGTLGNTATVYFLPRTQASVDDGVESYSGGAIFADGYASNYVIGTGTYITTVTLNYTLASPMEAVMIRILSNGSATNNYTLDNFSLTPEPTTLSVLGLGALALLRKRR